MKRIRMKKGIPKLNLIPIMDAVFIFIFYLLMSAQFIDIYEVGSDVARTAASVPDKKVPLNLTLRIGSTKIDIMTGVPGRLYKSVQLEGAELTQVLALIKAQHPTEKAVIIIPASDLKYKDLIVALDQVKPSFQALSFGE